MNAAASVLGSVLAMVIAIQFGLTVDSGLRSRRISDSPFADAFVASLSDVVLALDFVMIQRGACSSEGL